MSTDASTTRAPATRPGLSRVAAVVPLDGRGELVFSQLHDSPLFLHALRAVAAQVEEVVVRADADQLDRARVDVAAADLDVAVLDPTQWWRHVRATAPRTLIVHDPLCPLTPVELVARLLGSAGPASLAAFRPVTDTVKTVVDGAVSATLDRAALAALTSPVLVAAEVLADALAGDDAPPLHDVRALVAWLRERGPVELVGGPSIGRRVDDDSAVLLLECVDEVGRRVHH